MCAVPHRFSIMVLLTIITEHVAACGDSDQQNPLRRCACVSGASYTVMGVMQAVPYDLSLAAVRQYIWKRSDDPVLHYGRQTPGRPAPMPTMKPVQ